MYFCIPLARTPYIYLLIIHSVCWVHFTRMQTKFYRTYPHHIEGWAGLFNICIVTCGQVDELTWLRQEPFFFQLFATKSPRTNSKLDHTPHTRIFCSVIYIYILSNLPIQVCSSHIAQYTRMETNVIYYKFKLFLFIINNNNSDSNDACRLFTYVNISQTSTCFCHFFISSWKTIH